MKFLIYRLVLNHNFLLNSNEHIFGEYNKKFIFVLQFALHVIYKSGHFLKPYVS